MKIFIFLFFPLAAFAQESIVGNTIICYGTKENVPIHLLRPTGGLGINQRKQQSGKISSIFEITYVGFSGEEKNAFQYAIDIWQNELHSNVTIHVNAILTLLEGNLLATTRATKLYRGFEGAVLPTVWYPVALAEKITGKDLNETTSADIEISLNKNIKWYFGTDGNTPAGYNDLISVVLHEIAHGLGFSSSAGVTNNQGILRDEKYISIYDLLLENSVHKRLSSFADPSITLKDQLTSNSLYLYSPSAFNSMGWLYPKIFAPNFFSEGSSISHLEESEYPAGNPNALMSPYFAMNESIHILGNILPGVLNDMGWGDGTQKPNNMVVYPNPSSGIIKLQIEAPITSSDVTLSLVDISGQEIFNSLVLIEHPYNTIDLSYLPSGLYIVKICSPGITIAKKIVLLK